MAFFNSEVCTQLINVINPSTNNSANYIKKIPFIKPSEKTLNNVNNLVVAIIRKIGEDDSINGEERQLNNIFKELYGI